MAGLTYRCILMAILYTMLYAVVSRLPMIFAMVHMVHGLKLTGFVPAFIFCGYCVSRLIGAACTANLFGMPIMVFGTVTGIIGYAAIFMWPESAAVFGPMVVLTGLTETVTGIDVTLKLEVLLEDFELPREQLLFRWQMISSTVGSFIAYLGGGYIFSVAGIPGICVMGGGASLVNLIVLLVYCFSRANLCFAWRLSVDRIIDALEQEVARLSVRLDEQSSDGEKVARIRNSIVQAKHRQQSLRCSQQDWRRSLQSMRNSAVGIQFQMGATGSIGHYDHVRLSVLSMIDASAHVANPLGVDINGRPSVESCDPLVMAKLDSGKSAKSGSEELEMEKAGSAKSGTSVLSARDLPTYESMSAEEKRKVWRSLCMVVVSFYVTVLPISNNFGVLALYWREVWNESTTTAGLLMALGEFGGAVTLFALAQRWVFDLWIMRPFKKPVNLVLATVASSAVVAGVIIPQFYISAICSIGVHVANVLLHSFCSECAAAWAPRDVYAFWIGACYMTKRFSNATVAFMTINLFLFVGPRWPYAAVSCLVFSWGIVLLAMFWKLRLFSWQQKSQNAPIAGPTILTSQNSLDASEQRKGSKNSVVSNESCISNIYVTNVISNPSNAAVNNIINGATNRSSLVPDDVFLALSASIDDYSETGSIGKDKSITFTV